jgi:Flp pilus assembly protein TadB
MTNKISPEVQEQAMKVAKASQKPGQTKEQTKRIAQGIEKGISDYKKQQSKKARIRDKDRKVQNRQTDQARKDLDEPSAHTNNNRATKLPWLLLLLSWLVFAVYLLLH